MIFQNVATGIPIEDVMAAFCLSQLEVEQEVAFVGKKIKEYRFRRHMPPLPCEAMKDIRWHHKALLETLSKLGPKYLSSELILPKVVIQSVDNPKELMEAGRQARVL